MTTIHEGNLDITEENAHQFEHLVEVRGDLHIDDPARLPALKTVNGSLFIHAESVELPALETVAEHLGADCINTEFPALKTVGGDLGSGFRNKFPVLGTVGGTLDNETDMSAPALRSIAGHELAAPEILEARLRAVAEAALAEESALHMGSWHHCDTTHCIAGWAIHQHGEAGYEMERKYGPETAGAILLGIEAANHFFVPTDVARVWLRSKLPEAA
jgi:hypothetical protein